MVVEDLKDVVLIVLGYGYVLASILLSREASRRFGCSAETGRKLLHILVENLVFLVPLFKNWFSPVVKVFTRYLMGTAYLPRPLHEATYLLFASTLPTSNLMFILDVTPGEAQKRLEQRGESSEMFESLEELEEMRDRVLGLAWKYGWTIVDADKSVREVHNRIVRLLVEKQTTKSESRTGTIY